MYCQRLANYDDAEKIAPLWQAFLQERSQIDPMIILKPNFDYQSYVRQQLQNINTYGFLLENEKTQEIVGFLWVYVNDETVFLDRFNSPFVPRRMGSAIAMYVKKEHRYPQAIQLLVTAAITLAEELKISDIDVLISYEQTGIHHLLERLGFTKSAIQYTKHYEVTAQDLHPLKRKLSEEIAIKKLSLEGIPLRDPQTQKPVFNAQGQPLFLYPLKDDQGQLLYNSGGLPIYPTPLRDPQTQDWVFDELGQLVVCPVVLNAEGKVVEYQGIPQFKKPIYEQVNGALRLKCDPQGNYLFEE